MLRYKKWIKDNFPTDPPFSFIYNGKDSKEFLKEWTLDQKTEKLDEVSTRKVFTYKDSLTNLQMCCEAIIYEDFPVVEWVIHFKNTGKTDTPIIENIQALNTIFPSKGEYNIHSIEGSGGLVTDFKPIVECVSKGMDIVAGCFGGRGSNGGLRPSQLGGRVPFFNMEEVDADRGIIAAIGWTGQWLANFIHETESTILVKAGMEQTNLKLLPGECIRTPRILVLFWEGPDYLLGNNLLRRFIVAHKLPKINGKPIEVPIGANTWFKHIPPIEMRNLPKYKDGGNDFTEQNQIAFARRCKELGIEYYWLDAGWFEGGWPFGTGNWFVKKEGFPNGLKGLSNALKKIGIKFILWFEPERVCLGTKLWREHPEWLLHRQNQPKECEYLERNYSLLNLGNMDACRWLIDHISKMITEYGIDVYRQDFNIDPLTVWRDNDADDRKGITEIHYIDGLYTFWDELLKRHPGLIIDNCASGGRRIDIETISRSTTFWRSDFYSPEPITGIQCATYGLNLYMPGHATSAHREKVDKYGFRSSLSGGAAISWDIDKDDFPDDCARMLIEEAKQLRPLFYGDFWPLTPYSLSINCWIAWQFDRPDLGTGAVFAFRRSNRAENTIKLFLKGIKPDGRYEVIFVDTDIKRTFTGIDLMEKGLEVKEDSAPVSVLITYNLINQGV